MSKSEEEAIPNTLHVYLNKGVYTGICNPEKTILENIETMGVPIRSACRRGLCGSCKIQVITGDLHPNKHVVEDNYVLACSSVLTSSAIIAIDDDARNK